MGVDTLVRDPQFINLPLAQQRLALQAATGDKDFASISDNDFTLFLNAARNATPTGFEKERTPGPNGGAWNAIKSDVGGAAEGLSSMATNSPAGTAIAMGARTGANEVAREKEGRSLPYRVLADLGENVTPLNVRGMEEAANSGDTSGVAGHAAAGTAMAAAPLTAEAALKAIPAARVIASRAAAPAAAAADTAAGVLDNPIVGTFSPRLRNAGSALGKLADLLKAQKARSVPTASSSLPETIPDEVAYPVTTPSDVPLEHIPEDLPPNVPPEIANIYRLKRGWQDNFEDAQIRQAMSDDLYRHGVNAGREVRAQQLAERQAAGLDVPKWQRTAQVQAQSILDEAQRQANSVMENARQKSTRNLMSSVPRNVTAEAAAEEIANQPPIQTTADKLSATASLEDLLRASIAKVKAAKAKAQQ